MSTCSSPCYCTNLRRAARAVTRFYDHVLESSGLRVTQFALLVHLHTLGPVPLHRLAEAVKLERTTLLRNLHGLESRNLVSKRAAAKAHIIGLTPQGERLLCDAMPRWEAAQKKIHAALTDEEHAVLGRALQRLEALAP